MRTKTIAQSVLLVLLGSSILAWAVKSFGGSDTAVAPAPTPAAAPDDVPAAAAVLADGVAVINFHGAKR